MRRWGVVVGIACSAETASRDTCVVRSKKVGGREEDNGDGKTHKFAACAWFWELLLDAFDFVSRDFAFSLRSPRR